MLYYGPVLIIRNIAKDYNKMISTHPSFNKDFGFEIVVFDRLNTSKVNFFEARYI